MKKHNLHALILLVAIGIPLIFSSMFACNSEEEELEVVMISIQDDSFNAVYVAGSSLSLDNAQLIVRYIDGSVKVIPITEDMITEFDTVTTGEKKLRVTYKGITATHNYTVISATRIETPVKFTLTKYSDDGFNLYVDVNITGTQDEDDGVYAFSFDIALVGCVVGSVGDSLPKGFESSYSIDGGNVKFLAYSLDGYTKYPSDGRVCRILVLDKKDTAGATIQNIKVQNGKKDVTSSKSTLDFDA